MNTMYEELARESQRQHLAEAASQRLAYRVNSAHRWRRAEAWVVRRRARAELASREASDAS
jgi:hypothetical protein